MRWTVRIDGEGTIVVIPLQSPRPTLAYAFLEADRAGNILLDRVDALGVPRGRCLTLLKEGRSVVTPEGRLVTSEMVLSGVKPGRKILIMGACTSCSSLERHEVARDVDVLLVAGVRPVGGAWDKDRGDEGQSHLLASEDLGRIAASLGARHVLLARFDWWLHGQAAHPYHDPVVHALVDQVSGV